MRIEFDSAKDAANKAKHGVSLALADSLEWDRMLVRPDDRHDYGELRYIGIAPLASRLYVIVYTQRNDAIRVINVRKANSREVLMYEKANKVG